MKFLVEWHSKPKNRKALMKILETWKQPDALKTLFAAHYCVGANRGFAVFETDNAEAIQEGLRVFLDHTDYVVTPILPMFPEK